jgi:hypothetical protein
MVENALDAAQALDRSLTLDAVRGLDADALRKFEAVMLNWQQIALHERQRRENDSLDKILIGMATVAPEVDAMGQEEKLKAFELFGSMVDAAIAERATA